MMNIENALNEANKILKKKNIISYNLDTEILLSKVIKKDRKFVILNQEQKLNKFYINYFKKLIKERSNGKPIAYLLGKKSFWNSEFEIKEGTLIPRPETELLVEEVLMFTRNKKNLKILDIGVGSGCIILSILKEKKDFYGIGIDICKKSLDLSERNAKCLGLKNRVKFIKSDVDNFNNGKYDLIVSNPPYIKRANLKYLNKEVANFEPKLALDGGVDGLSGFRKIIKKSSELIKINGKLFLEIGFDQKKEIKKILKSKGFYINKVLKDYAGKDRCIVSTKTTNINYGNF